MGLVTIKITGIASKLGSVEVPIENMIDRFGKDPERVKRSLGVERLHKIDLKEETIYSLAEDAANAALTNAGIKAFDLSGIYASASSFGGNYLVPGPARILGQNLHIANIPMISISMTCAGGMHALSAAYNQLVVDKLNGRKSNYLVVVGDHSDRVLDLNKWETAPLFNDGISALVVSNDPSWRGTIIEEIAQTTLPGDIYAMNIPNSFAMTQLPNHYFNMNGKGTYEFAVTKAFPAILNLLRLGGLPQDSYFIPHQASPRIIKEICRRNGLDESRVYSDGAKNGNTTGASVFTGLEDVLSRNLAKGCEEIILGAFGAELQVAAARLRIDKDNIC